MDEVIFHSFPSLIRAVYLLQQLNDAELSSGCFVVPFDCTFSALDLYVIPCHGCGTSNTSVLRTQLVCGETNYYCDDCSGAVNLTSFSYRCNFGPGEHNGNVHALRGKIYTFDCLVPGSLSTVKADTQRIVIHGQAMSDIRDAQVTIPPSVEEVILVGFLHYMHYMAKTLIHVPAIRRLVIHDTFWDCTDDNLAKLCTKVKGLRALQCIELYWAGVLTVSGLDVLLSVIQPLLLRKFVVRYPIMNMYITDTTLLSPLLQAKNLSHLDLYYCGCREEVLVQIVEAVRESVVHLDVGRLWVRRLARHAIGGCAQVKFLGLEGVGGGDDDGDEELSYDRFMEMMGMGNLGKTVKEVNIDHTAVWHRKDDVLKVYQTLQFHHNYRL